MMPAPVVDDAASLAADTVATIAGTSVAITEAEEDASSFAAGVLGTDTDADTGAVAENTDTATGTTLLMTRSSSCSLDIALPNDDDDADTALATAASAAEATNAEEVDDDADDDEEEALYAAPMHLHALRTPAKLRGAPRSRSSSRSRPGSRRNSSSPPSRNLSGTALSELVITGTAGVSPSISVGSSLDGIDHHLHHLHAHHSHHGSSSSSSGGELPILIDRDILLDKLGFRDLDPETTQGEMQELLRKHSISGNNGSSLPTLNERMSEEALEDVHAFTNLTFCKRPSSGSSGSNTVEEVSEMSSSSMAAVVPGEEYLSPERTVLLREGYNMAGNKSLSSPAALQLNTLDEEEDEEGVDEDNDGGVIEEEEEEDEGKDGDDILDIPDGMILLREKPILNGKLTSSIATLGLLSSTACGEDDDDGEDEDDDDAEVEVPTSIMKELDINEGKRHLLHRDTSMMVVGGSDMDFLEDDEQDGLEADLANVRDEPR
ncbi:hypothetical protein ACHAWU_002372 [Discostella pseudostelligera]|uniref:Uncharacterized protein n=1 Tax=Discostella pseudostelligera TaxID=259834 RepID=A0ABD3MG47_9STRA